MNATECLRFCHQIHGNFPNDFRTALHVLDWLADKAQTEAVTVDDFEAIEAAKEKAKELLS